MPDFKLTLQIDKVGDLEALNALNALDAKGRRIIEGASGATGRAMGEVALAYERGSKSVRLDLEAIAKEHERNIAVMQREAAAAGRMAFGSAQGLGRIRQGMTSLVAQLTGTMPVLDRVLGAFGGLAVGSLPLIGVLGGIAAITEGYKLLTAQAKEAAAQADALADAFSRVAHMDLVSQAQEATKLYSGDKYAKDPLDRFGISGLQQQQAQLEARVKSGTATLRDPVSGAIRKVMSEDAAQAAETLDKVKRKLDQIVPLYQSIMGPGGSFADAAQRQVASDQPGFVTDALNQGAKDTKAAERLAKRQADAYQRALAADMKEATKLAVKSMVDDAETTYTAQNSIIAELVPSKKQIDEAVKFAAQQISASLEHDPVLAFRKSVQKLADEMKQALAQTLGEALSAGFEAAFSGKGIGDAFKSLTATVLAGIGGFMEALGAQMIVVGIGLEAFATAVKSLNGIAAIAAGVALVAAGAGLKAVAGSFGSGHSAGAGGSYGGGYSSGGLAQIIDRGVINPGAYTNRSASSITARPSVTNNVTIIGPNDASAQRAWDELQKKSMQRGSLAPVGA